MSTLARRAAAAAFAAALLVPALARAQDQPPDPEEVKKKILEIERLMKSAEQSLARSTDTRSAAEKSAEAAKKILDERAKKETGKSAEELKKLAESGSQEAAKKLEELTKAANEEAQEAAKKMTEVLGGGSAGAGGGSSGSGKGIREIIEKIKGDGQGASAGIKWLLDKTRTTQGPPQGGGGGEEKDRQKQPDAPDPRKPDEKPKSDDKKPESKTEPPRTPQFEQWYAELPAQVRKAYDSQDWDSIPPKWREMLKEWTKKMADELEKERH
jgi:hypothetical protein